MKRIIRAEASDAYKKNPLFTTLSGLNSSKEYDFKLRKIAITWRNHQKLMKGSLPIVRQRRTENRYH